MILYCPRCGAPFAHSFKGQWFETAQACGDCGVAASDPPAMLAPSDGEVTYGLDEWPVTDRSALTAALVADGVPYRWEPGIVLAVPSTCEKSVDSVLDDLESADQGLGADGGDDDGGDDDGGDDDGGEDAHAAMSDLFLAADRLVRAPDDPEMVKDLGRMTSLVGSLKPPYGIDGRTWREMAAKADAVGQGFDADDRVARAVNLRELLRSYV